MIQNNEKLLILTKNTKGETFSIPTKQRALVLQGGGALGYYEIGVLQSICDNLFNNIESKDENYEVSDERKIMNASNLNLDDQVDKNNDKIIKQANYGEQFFDIIAGVSIGAINAVFLIDYVPKEQWQMEWCNSKTKGILEQL